MSQWIGHQILAKNLKTVSLWVLIIKRSTFIFLNNVRLLTHTCYITIFPYIVSHHTHPYNESSFIHIHLHLYRHCAAQRKLPPKHLSRRLWIQGANSNPWWPIGFDTIVESRYLFKKNILKNIKTRIFKNTDII